MEGSQELWEACSNLVRTVRGPDGAGGFLVAECPVNMKGSRENAIAIAKLHNESIQPAPVSCSWCRDDPLSSLPCSHCKPAEAAQFVNDQTHE